MEFIKDYKIENIQMWENNPRKNDEAVDKLIPLLKEHGMINPVILDQNGILRAGHTRIKALKKMGRDTVPALIVNFKDEAHAIAYGIADNKLSEWAEWDFKQLKELITDLDNFDFDLEMTGFDLDEMGDILTYEKEDKEIVEDEIPEEPENYISQKGDIWLLGKHRLMCGDSTNEDVDILMDGKKADMIFTDPPYLMGFTGNVNTDGSKSFNTKHGAIKNDKMSKKDGEIFINKIFEKIKDNVIGAFYVCFYRLGLEYLFKGIEINKLEYKSLIIWNKSNHTLSGSDYMSKYEPILYGWVKEHNFYGDRSNFDIWDIERTKKNDLHPTMKPLNLIKKAILNSSLKENIVLDLFGGSGSTLIASEQLERVCYMMELDEKYVDVIVQRYINLKESDEDVYLIRDNKKIAFKELI